MNRLFTILMLTIAVVSCNKGGEEIDNSVSIPEAPVYEVGDIYRQNYGSTAITGIVIKVDKGGRSGLIFNYDMHFRTLWSEYTSYIGLTDSHDGEKNRKTVEHIENFESKFPIYKTAALNNPRCFYLPSVEELSLMLLDMDVRAKVNAAMIALTGYPLEGCYWSSTESDDGQVWVVDADNLTKRLVAKDANKYRAQCVAKFPAANIHTDELQYQALKKINDWSQWGVYVMRHTFDNVNYVGNVIFDNNLTFVPDNAFLNNANFFSLVMPISIRTIGQSAFESSAIVAITLSPFVQSIGKRAFANCSGLKSVSCLATTPPAVEQDAELFAASDKVVIYVPESAVDAYCNAPGWCDYAEKIQGKEFN